MPSAQMCIRDSKTIVRERDPHAIVTVADVTEAFGEGFKDISA